MLYGGFFQGVRDAVSLVVPRHAESDEAIGPTDFEAVARRTDLWLSPSTVREYRESDMRFLTEPQRSRLTAAVEAFLAVAESVEPESPADREQIEAALPHYLTIVNTLWPVMADPEAIEVARRLGQLVLPEIVHALRYELGLDWTNDPMIVVAVIVTKEPFKKAEWERIRSIETTVGGSLKGSGRFVLNKLRLLSEERAIAAGTYP